MKKIKFNCLKITGNYDKNLNLITELKEIQGYYFSIFDYHFVVHRFVFDLGHYDGWRVSELTSGCGVTKPVPTRKEAMKCFAEMQKQKYDGLDFFAALKQCVADIIKIYGKANDIEKVI